MVTNGYEEQTRRLLAETKSELDTLEQQITGLQERKVILLREAGAFETALEGYLRREGKQSIVKDDWVELLKGMTHKEQLLEIASRNRGKIKVSEATDILYGKRLIQSKKRANAYIIVQSILSQMAENSDSFKKIAPGEYKLINVQQTLTLPK